MKLRVEILLKGKERLVITVTCDRISCATNNSVTCYDYTNETAEHYDGWIVSVEPA